MNAAVECLRDLGAVLIEAPIANAGRVGGPGSTIEVAVTNRFSPLTGRNSPISTVFFHEFKNGLNDYLSRYATATPMRSLADIIRFNDQHRERALRFGQDLLTRAEATSGALDDPDYASARRFDLETAQAGLDGYLETHRLDAVLFPANIGAQIAAKAGYPSVSVPGGFLTTAGKRSTPPYPFGVTFSGRAFSEPTLLALAYAFEQATRARRPPASTPPLAI